LNNSNRPKKLLYIGIILILISIIFTGISITKYDDVSVAQEAYVLLHFAIFALPPLIVGIILLRKYSRTSKLQEKLVSSKPQQPPKQQHNAGKTQFWVCPVCGNDTKEYHGKSYCNHCERYF